MTTGNEETDSRIRTLTEAKKIREQAAKRGCKRDLNPIGHL